MKFGNVIVTFNRKELLLEAINSLLRQSVYIDKIVIVDNHSTDGTYDFLEKSGVLVDKRIDYYYLRENIGGSGGFEYGMRKAMQYDLDWITLSDDDAIYEENYFSYIEDEIMRNKDISIFTGTVKLEDGRIQNTHRRIISNWNTLSYRMISESSYNKNFYVDLFTFVGATISTKLIRKIGYPEKDFFIWWDDLEYSLRARNYTKILNVSKAVVLHKTKIVSMDFSKKYKADWREYYGWRNRIVTLRKHSKNRLVINLFLIAWMVKRYARLVKPFYKHNRLHLVKLYTRAFYDAYTKHLGINNHYKP